MRGLSVIHTASSYTDQLPFRLFSLLSLALLFHFRFPKRTLSFLFFFTLQPGFSQGTFRKVATTTATVFRCACN